MQFRSRDVHLQHCQHRELSTFCKQFHWAVLAKYALHLFKFDREEKE